MFCLVLVSKDLFRSASEFLHRATHGKVFFKEVTIEIPSTWPAKQSMDASGGNLFETAAIRVDTPNPVYGDVPYTVQPRGCGERADYIHLTPGFVLASKDFNRTDVSAGGFI